MIYINGREIGSVTHIRMSMGAHNQTDFQSGLGFDFTSQFARNIINEPALFLFASRSQTHIQKHGASRLHRVPDYTLIHKVSIRQTHARARAHAHARTHTKHSSKSSNAAEIFFPPPLQYKAVSMATSSSFWHRKVETYRKYEWLPGDGQGDGWRTGVGGHGRGRGVGLGELGGQALGNGEFNVWSQQKPLSLFRGLNSDSVFASCLRRLLNHFV